MSANARPDAIAHTRHDSGPHTDSGTSVDAEPDSGAYAEPDFYAIVAYLAIGLQGRRDYTFTPSPGPKQRYRPYGYRSRTESCAHTGADARPDPSATARIDARADAGSHT